MDLKQILKQVRIDVITNTVFINNRFFNFTYTTINKNKVYDDYKESYRYLGGLQCEYDIDSNEYKCLEDKLIIIAEKVLEGIKC
jgi:hypothetical protein